MPDPAKKPTLKGDEYSSGSESDSDNFVPGEEIQADFEGRNPEVSDSEGIKQLLKQLFLKAHIDLSEMVDILIEQYGIGSVLKQTASDSDTEDEEVYDNSKDVFGITSVLNISTNEDRPCVQQLLDWMYKYIDKMSDQAERGIVQSIITNSHHVGLLINERFINIPPKIADPLFTSLMGELNGIKSKNDSYNFDYFVMICKLHRSKGEEKYAFVNAEEEIFSKHACVRHNFCVAGETDALVGGNWEEGDEQLIPYRSIIIIEGHKFNSIVQQVTQFVS